MTRRSSCSKFGEPNSETLLFCQMFSEFKRKAFVRITAPKFGVWVKFCTKKFGWQNRSSYVFGWTLTFQKSPSLFLFHLTGHYMHYNPCIGTLPEFGAALGCHLRQTPYSGNTPIPGCYLPLQFARIPLNCPFHAVKKTSEIRYQREIHLFLGCHLVTLWPCLHKEVL